MANGVMAKIIGVKISWRKYGSRKLAGVTSSENGNGVMASNIAWRPKCQAQSSVYVASWRNGLLQLAACNL
jgi:hypothetical protein